jgi:hypothetical protein
MARSEISFKHRTLAITLNKAMVETDLREDVRKMSVPTLLVHGDRDVSAPLEITRDIESAVVVEIAVVRASLCWRRLARPDL